MTLQTFVSGARKFLVAVVAALGVLALQLANGPVTTSGWLQIIIAFAGALGVYGVTNTQIVSSK